jgi:thiamine kinase-like enzyme
VETPEILRIKSWGVTARFGSVVLKVAYTPLFPQVVGVHNVLKLIEPKAAPRLIANGELDGQFLTLFEFLPGVTAEESGTSEALVAVAGELARVQTSASKLDLSGLPVLHVGEVLNLLLEDDLSDQPIELVQWFHKAESALRLDARALAEFPLSLDHPDVNASNAMVQQDGDIVLLDWEEATVGCPFFSLERLVEEAREHSAVDPVCEAYLENLPWGNREGVERAMRFVPLKLAWENRTFARKLGWAHPHTSVTTALLKLARKRSTEGFEHTGLSDFFGP